MVKKKVNKLINSIIVFIVLVFVIDFGCQSIQLANNSTFTIGSGYRVRTKGRMQQFLYQYEVNGKKYTSPRTYADSLKVGKKYVVLYSVSDPCINILLDSSCINSDIDYSDILHHLSKKPLMGHLFGCN